MFYTVYSFSINTTIDDGVEGTYISKESLYIKYKYKMFELGGIDFELPPKLCHWNGDPL